MTSMPNYSVQIEKIKSVLKDADAVLVGAGAGLSVSAGFTYSGTRFHEHFSDFHEKYGFDDMYYGGFYPFPSPEEFWAYWSRYILINRYTKPPKPVYPNLLEIIKDKNYFVITTNVDHCFQRAGFWKDRMFYTQGDFGLLQCSVPCHNKTYDNEELIRQMAAEQKDMKIPSALIPRCPVCGKPMTMNLRSDDKFVEDSGWHAANERYGAFLNRYGRQRIVLLELGVGENTPGIIKFPFWQMTAQNKRAAYVCVNKETAECPRAIQERSVCIHEDIGSVLEQILQH